MSPEHQRIDRWLWHARVVRTRTNAAALAQSGHVRVNGQRIGASARTIRPGDVLTVALPGTVKVLRVLGFTERRGAFSEAKCLYEDLSPPKERTRAAKKRGETSGRYEKSNQERPPRA